MWVSTPRRSCVGFGTPPWISIGHVSSLDLLEIVLAANRRAPDVQTWSRSIIEAARPLDSNNGMTLATIHRGPSGISFSDVFSTSPEMAEVFNISASRVPENFQRVFRECATLSGKTSSMVFGQRAYRASRELHDGQGARDALGMFWHLDASRIIGLFVNLPRVTTLDRRAVNLRRLVAVHIATARRSYDRSDVDEAWLSPDGKVLDASANAEADRDQLSLRVRAIEAARHAADEEEALVRWKALVSGQWSLVEVFESDGRRMFVARKNPLPMGRQFALTSAEETVLKLVALGNSQKLVAYSLGISEGAVSMHLRGATLKLGLRNRAAILELGDLVRERPRRLPRAS